MNQRMTKENHYFQIVEISSHKTRKDERIMGLQPIMEAGKFHLPEKPIKYTRLWESPDDGKGKEVDIVLEFVAEFDFFPNSAHDDLLDSAQMARHIVEAGYIPTPGSGFAVGSDYGINEFLQPKDEVPSAWV
jgi:hypothetical protein